MVLSQQSITSVPYSNTEVGESVKDSLVSHIQMSPSQGQLVFSNVIHHEATDVSVPRRDSFLRIYS